MKGGPKNSDPEIYQELNWKVDDSLNNMCTIKHTDWNADFMVCMKKTLPQADIGIFEKSPASDELEFVAFRKEYESDYLPPNFRTSYHAGCYGDIFNWWLFFHFLMTTPKYETNFYHS